MYTQDSIAAWGRSFLLSLHRLRVSGQRSLCGGGRALKAARRRRTGRILRNVERDRGSPTPTNGSARADIPQRWTYDLALSVARAALIVAISMLFISAGEKVKFTPDQCKVLRQVGADTRGLCPQPKPKKRSRMKR